MSKHIARAAAVAAISALAATGLSTATATAAPKPKTPKVTAADVTVDEGAGTATVTLTVNKKSKKKVKLNWSTLAGPKSKTGSAKAGQDFTAERKGRIVLAPGEKTATLTVAIIDDDLVEKDETFRIKFSGKAVKVKRPAITVTIRDNDTAPEA